MFVNKVGTRKKQKNKNELKLRVKKTRGMGKVIVKQSKKPRIKPWLTRTDKNGCKNAYYEGDVVKLIGCKDFKNKIGWHSMTCIGIFEKRKTDDNSTMGSYTYRSFRVVQSNCSLINLGNHALSVLRSWKSISSVDYEEAEKWRLLAQL